MEDMPCSLLLCVSSTFFQCIYLHKCAPIATSVHPSPQVCIYLHKCASISTSVHLSPRVCIHLHKCASISTSVHLSTQVCIYLHKFAPISTNVHQSPQVCTYLHKCASISSASISTSVHVCCCKEGLALTRPHFQASNVSQFTAEFLELYFPQVSTSTNSIK